MKSDFKNNFIILTVLVLAAIFLLAKMGDYPGVLFAKKTPIRIGILHSLSGTMAESEKSLVDVLLMGIEEINAKGGLLGRQLEAIVVDGRSDWDYSAKQAERLIVEQKVDVIFGCWTSSCRKAIKPVIEKHQHLLFYPVQYEGLEESDNIIYTGATPNQQIIPGVNWALKKFGQRVYLLGSDYIYPRTANFIIRDIVNIKNAEVVAERYVSMGSDNFDEIVAEIEKLKPDVILSTINGDSNNAFFKKRHQAGIDNIPVVSFSIAEAGLANIPEARTKTHFAVWSYFQSIDNPVNHEFVTRIHERLGSTQVVSDPMEASYIGLNLWAQAVHLAESTDIALVLKTINEQVFNAPEGIVSIDSSNHHMRKIVRIGQARFDGQFDIIWQSKYAIRPVSFPTYRSRDEWVEVIKKISLKGND